MTHFAFFTEFFFGLGDFFKWSFGILPSVGIFMGWLFSGILFLLLVWWCIQIISFGKNDKRIRDYREPHNFIED